MGWKPIVVGVDGSPESVRAAVAGAAIAQRAGTTCTLVAAVADYERVLVANGMMTDVAAVAHSIVLRDRETIMHSLQGYVPEKMRLGLEVHAGAAPLVLAEAAKRLDAGMIVVGHRQHRGLDRLRGRIVRHLVRTCDIPLLVTDGRGPQVERILVALDLSYASGPALDMAQEWARLYGARLRAVHVVEPMPTLPSEAGITTDAFDRADETLLASGTWAHLDARIEKVVRPGHAAFTIAREASEWKADLLILASHGGGWLNRLLIGSTSEDLLHSPPTMTLVVPAARSPGDATLEIGALPWEERAGVVASAG